MHATILAYMFTLVEENKIASPLFDPTKVQAASNMDYIQKYVAELLKQAFPHLQEYVDSCLNSCQRVTTFQLLQAYLRDC